MKIRSFSVKLILIISTILLFACALLGSIGYSLSASAVKEEVDKSLEELATNGGLIIREYLDSQLNSLRIIAQLDMIKDETISVQEKLEVLRIEFSEGEQSIIMIADTSGNAHVNTGAEVNISERDYFIEAMKGKPVVSEPFVNKIDNIVIITYATPIIDNNKIVGVLVRIGDANNLSMITNEIKFGKTGSTYMIDNNGTVIAHQDPDMVINLSNNIRDLQDNPHLTSLVEIEEKMTAGEKGAGYYTLSNITNHVGYAPVPGTTWSIGVVAQEKEVMQNIYELRSAFLYISITLILLGAILMFFIGRSLSKPLNIFAAFTKELAKGNLSVRVPEKYMSHEDEFGILARSFDTMIVSFKELIGGIISLSNEVTISSDILTEISQSAACSMQEVSASTEEIAATLEQVAASSQEINSSSIEMKESVDTLNGQMSSGNHSAKEIEDKAEMVYQVVENNQIAAKNKLETLEERLKVAIEKAKIIDEISHMAALISNFAKQTNLLALNASIEAARAGDQGKGFAVVAEEVSKLAKESTTTVANIQELTQQVQGTIKQLTNDTNELLQYMSNDVEDDYKKFLNTANNYKEDARGFYNLTSEAVTKGSQVGEVVSQVTMAIDEITISIAQSSNSIQEIAKGTEFTSGTIVEVNETSIKLSKMVEDLNQLTNQFTI